MVGLQILVTIQSDKRQEFLQAIDMLCIQKATEDNGADDYIFEAVDTPNRFFYLKQCTDRRLLENFLKTDRFRALLGDCTSIAPDRGTSFHGYSWKRHDFVS